MGVSAPVDQRLYLPRRRKLSVKEFLRAGRLGLYAPDERLELIEGEVIRKVSPQATKHATGIRLSEVELGEVFDEGYDVRAQLPMTLGIKSMPEPDIAVVPGSIRDYQRSHPSSAVLIVEVADSTLRLDRTTKAALYARHGIGDYWILNLVHRLLEVHRDPIPDPDEPLGYRYSTVIRLSETDTISPLAAPHALILVSDLMPSA